MDKPIAIIVIFDAELVSAPLMQSSTKTSSG